MVGLRAARGGVSVVVGWVAAIKLGVDRAELRLGRQGQFEGRRWVVSGIFSAAGAAFESEVWCRQDELGVQMQREDLSLVAMRFGRDGTFGDLQMFCSERKDLNLQAIRETDYYALLQRDYGPIRWLAGLAVGLVAPPEVPVEKFRETLPVGAGRGTPVQTDPGLALWQRRVPCFRVIALACLATT